MNFTGVCCREHGRQTEGVLRSSTCDDELVAESRTVVDSRASYGYRRVTAMVKRFVDDLRRQRIADDGELASIAQAAERANLGTSER